MKTVSPALPPMQDQPLGEIDNSVQSLFHEKAEQWARSTGFVQRSSKITGSAFAQTVVLGFLNQPQASSTDLPQTLEFQGIDVSPQAKEARMTAEAAALMGRFLQEMVAMVVSGQECHIPTLQSFDGVSLQDGTVLTLPDELRDDWRGEGGDGRRSGTACAATHQLEQWAARPVPGCKMLAPANIQGRRPAKLHHCPRERSLSPITAL